MAQGAEVLGQLLLEQGVTHIFGIPGGQVLSLMDVIRRTPTIRFVTTRHEGGAAAMADAYGRMTGRPGVCLATTGPGATNLLTGVGGALKDSSPMVILVVANNLRDHGRDDAQDLDHVAVFRPLVKAARKVMHAGQLIEAVRHAFRTAVTGCPGPVLLEFSRELLEFEAEEVLDLGAPPAPPVRPEPSGEALAQLVEVVNQATRPVFWLGNGAKIARAGEALLQIAEQAHIPIVTTYNGSGVVPTAHPLVFGSVYRHGSALTHAVVAEADVVIAIGNSFNAISTGRWSLKMRDLIQVDVDPLIMGRYYPVRQAMVSDAKMLADRLRHATWVVPERRREWVETLQQQRREWTASLAQEDTPRGVDPVRVFGVLRESLREPANFLIDAGNPGIWSQVMPLHSGDFYLKPVGFGNMGFALPGAIAAGLVDATRLAVAVVGDGSLGMTLAELETARREGVHLLAVVLDDEGYGNIRQEQQYKFGLKPQETIGVAFSPVDYVHIAEAFGWIGWRAGTTPELAEVMPQAVAAAQTRPTMVQVRIDGNRTVWPTAY